MQVDTPSPSNGQVACDLRCQEPFDFGWCETHDVTFPLGGTCRFNGRDAADVYAQEAAEQRVRAVRAEDAAQWWRDVALGFATGSLAHSGGSACPDAARPWARGPGCAACATIGCPDSGSVNGARAAADWLRAAAAVPDPGRPVSLPLAFSGGWPDPAALRQAADAADAAAVDGRDPAVDPQWRALASRADEVLRSVLCRG